MLCTDAWQLGPWNDRELGSQLEGGTQPPPVVRIDTGWTSCTFCVQGGGSDHVGIDQIEYDRMDFQRCVRDDGIRVSSLAQRMLAPEYIHDGAGF